MRCRQMFFWHHLWLGDQPSQFTAGFIDGGILSLDGTTMGVRRIVQIFHEIIIIVDYYAGTALYETFSNRAIDVVVDNNNNNNGYF